MKKPTICLFILLTCCQTIFAQKIQVDTVRLIKKVVPAPFGNYIRFSGEFYNEATWQDGDFAAGDNAIDKIYGWVKANDKHHADSLRHLQPKAFFFKISPLLLGVKLDPKLTYYKSDMEFGKAYINYTINNNTDAVMVAMGINADNVNDYRYHVVQNDSVELVPWSVPKLAKKYGAKKPFAIFGPYNVPGKQLMIEVVNKKNYTLRGGMIFDWHTNFRPVIDEVGAYLAGKADGSSVNLADTTVNRHFANRFDPATHLPTNLKFRQGAIFTIFLEFGYHAPAPYTVWLTTTTNGKTETKQLAQLGTGEGVYNLHDSLFREPGKYELMIQPMNKWEETQLARMPFEVLPAPPLLQRFTAGQLALYIGGVIIVGLLAFMIL
jgi:two-component system LytT family sensor kinase